MIFMLRLGIRLAALGLICLLGACGLVREPEIAGNGMLGDDSGCIQKSSTWRPGDDPLCLNPYIEGVEGNKLNLANAEAAWAAVKNADQSAKSTANDSAQDDSSSKSDITNAGGHNEGTKKHKKADNGSSGQDPKKGGDDPSTKEASSSFGVPNPRMQILDAMYNQAFSVCYFHRNRMAAWHSVSLNSYNFGDLLLAAAIPILGLKDVSGDTIALVSGLLTVFGSQVKTAVSGPLTPADDFSQTSKAMSDVRTLFKADAYFADGSIPGDSGSAQKALKAKNAADASEKAAEEAQREADSVSGAAKKAAQAAAKSAKDKAAEDKKVSDAAAAEANDDAKNRRDMLVSLPYLKNETTYDRGTATFKLFKIGMEQACFSPLRSGDPGGGSSSHDSSSGGGSSGSGSGSSDSGNGSSG